MRVKIISLDDRGSHSKLHVNTRESILRAGHEVVENDYDFVHYEEVVDLDQIYYPFILPLFKMSFVMIGFSYCLRHNQIETFKMLVNSPLIHRIIIMSIHPASLKCKIEELIGEIPPKVVFIDEPPCETREFYRSISKEDARNKLNILRSSKVVLYYGTYWYSRGADLLLEVVKDMPNIDFYMVGDTKKYNSFDFDIKRYQGDNIHWVDEWVTEEKARDYMRACDVVALPYRKFYEHDSSGVFNQAMLAERQVVVPDFSPFTNVIIKYNVGWQYGWRTGVGGGVKHAISHNKNDDFDKYLDAQTGWEAIGKCL